MYVTIISFARNRVLNVKNLWGYCWEKITLICCATRTRNYIYIYLHARRLHIETFVVNIS